MNVGSGLFGILQNERIGTVAFGLVVVGVLAITPFEAGFALRPFPQCEIAATWNMWLAALSNALHLVGYSILAALAAWTVGRNALWVAIAVTLLVSVGVELEQALFDEGHCRLRDMLPNVVAVTAGTVVAVGLGRLAALRSSAGNRS